MFRCLVVLYALCDALSFFDIWSHKFYEVSFHFNGCCQHPAYLHNHFFLRIPLTDSSLPDIPLSAPPIILISLPIIVGVISSGR